VKRQTKGYKTSNISSEKQGPKSFGKRRHRLDHDSVSVKNDLSRQHGFAEAMPLNNVGLT